MKSMADAASTSLRSIYDNAALHPWVTAATGTTVVALTAAMLARKAAKKSARLNSSPEVWALVGDAAQLTVADIDGGQNAASYLTTLSRPKQTSDTKETVVLIHGFGCTGLEWADSVVPGLLERQVQVFSYDRILFAEPAPGKKKLPRRTAPVLAAELRALLKARGLEPPFILVGHSYGGLIAQVYAMQFPSDVSGMVLIDPAHEKQNTLFPKDFAFSFKLVPSIFKVYSAIAWTGVLRLFDRLGLFNFPPVALFRSTKLRRTTVDLYSESRAWRRAAEELRGCNETFAAMSEFRQQNKPLPTTLPLAIVLAAHRTLSPTLYPAAVTQAFVDMCKPLAAATDGTVSMATNSDHWVHLSEPEQVLAAVDVVLGKVRSD